MPHDDRLSRIDPRVGMGMLIKILFDFHLFCYDSLGKELWYERSCLARHPIYFFLSLIIAGCLTSPSKDENKDSSYDCKTRTTVSGNSVISASNNHWSLQTGQSEKMCPVKVTIEYGWANYVRDDDKDRPENITVLFWANNFMVANPEVDTRMYTKDGKYYWKMSLVKSAAEVNAESPIIYSVRVGYNGSLNESYDEVRINVKIEHSIYLD